MIRITDESKSWNVWHTSAWAKVCFLLRTFTSFFFLFLDLTSGTCLSFITWIISFIETSSFICHGCLNCSSVNIEFWEIKSRKRLFLYYLSALISLIKFSLNIKLINDCSVHWGHHVIWCCQRLLRKIIGILSRIINNYLRFYYSFSWAKRASGVIDFVILNFIILFNLARDILDEVVL